MIKFLVNKYNFDIFIEIIRVKKRKKLVYCIHWETIKTSKNGHCYYRDR